jgi:hypothetical protein
MNGLRAVPGIAGLAIAAVALALAAPAGVAAHDPDFTADFDRARCTFTSVGSNPYFPLWPGYALHFEGDSLDDEGQPVAIANTITVLGATELVDGVETRVVEERESEDGELVEISRNFFVHCRETGDVWYFGEDVDDYEDGEIVGHDGAWRAGVDGAEPGILMPGTPLLGARHFQEQAPGVAADQAEVASLDETLDLPAGTFENLLKFDESSAIEPGALSEKWYAHGVGLVKDDDLELVEIEPPPCRPDATTHCLADGRFKVTAEWATQFGGSGSGQAILPSADSGEFWFFNPNNTELLVKVLDACDLPEFNSFWVFAAGLTNVEVTLTVEDTGSDEVKVYTNQQGAFFAPILDTSAFETCP